jgi:hypothetical protein
MPSHAIPWIYSVASVEKKSVAAAKKRGLFETHRRWKAIDLGSFPLDSVS